MAVAPEHRISEEDGSSVWQWLFIGWLNPLLKAGLKVLPNIQTASGRSALNCTLA